MASKSLTFKIKFPHSLSKVCRVSLRPLQTFLLKARAPLVSSTACEAVIAFRYFLLSETDNFLI